ncbi:endolytic transglycosylase MltG [Bifidobacterium sp. ESL0763]|uniref:endolytic transglycosylase MltG n=1 Tax=Bifidobacterium sp. ESL0763 TaxID=2983227 RepID=UPI0023F77896|nr:endolytic transglycosylase MltG [Bifidobacterium sp. ESL0763]MDF7663911.1 endolytic transglycosylase MltG [Bifidobacterium sp. ESL0763]
MAKDINELFDTHAEWVDNEEEQGGAEPPAPPRSRAEIRQRRALKRRKRTLVAIIVIVVVALLGTCTFFGVRTVRHIRAANRAQVQMPDYPGPGYGEVQFTINTGEGTEHIAKRLVRAQVVKSATTFSSTVAANGSTVYPGTYTLKKHMACAKVVSILSDQSKATGFLEVRAGERSSQVIADAAKLSGIDQSQFDAIVNGGGAGILPAEAGGKFEGWFEPGSYQVKGKKDAGAILKQMVDKRVARLDALKVPTGAQREQTLIIASIAESEVNLPQYYGKVTRVILNRIDQGMVLGMDSTVAYGANVSPGDLTEAMLEDASDPYNTRVNPGLPPTPISSPGTQAIKAAMAPTPGDWLYFVTTNLQTGETKFADNEADFEQLKQEYKSSNKDAN